MRTRALSHQSKILPIITNCNYYGLAWEMGTGKTWIGCYLIESDINKNNKSKTLIISPNSVTDDWEKQLLEHTCIPKDNICILSGNTINRIKLLNKNIPIYIINFEGLRFLSKELGNINWDILIVDESHRIKNPRAKQTQITLSLVGKKRLALSGTPILKDYLDIFSQCQFLDKGKIFGNNFYAFRNQYFIDQNSHRFRGNFPMWIIRPGSEGKIKNKISGFWNRLEKKDCLKNLPPKIEKTLYVFLNKEQQLAYKEMERHCITELEGLPITAPVAVTKQLRLSQITSGYLKSENGKIIEFKKNPKIELLIELVEEILLQKDGEYLNNNKIIIWAHFRHDINYIFKNLKKYNPVVIYGGTKNRNEIKKLFQEDKKYKIFIGQPGSAGEGLTLTAANYTIRYSYSFSLKDYLQSADRNHRKGSEMHESVTYIDIVAKDTHDEIVLKCLKNKENVGKAVYEYIKSHQNKLGG